MNNFKKGMIYTSIGVYSNFLLQLVVSMVLSRLLTPKDYGVVAIMQIFIIFFALVIEAGMGPAIIQNNKLTKQDTRVLFNYSALFAIVMAALFGGLGLLLSSIYGNPIYKTLTWVQSISVLMNGLNIVPTAILNKGKQFKLVNFSAVFGNIIAAMVGITMAFLGAGVYSLIASTIVSSTINFILNKFFANLKFISTWSLGPLKVIWNFSKNQFGANFVNYLSRNTDNILIGKFMGASQLANYNKAYNLVLLPNQLFQGVISPVLQPVLANYQDDEPYIRKNYLRIIHILALLGIPISVFFCMSAKQIIFFMYGSQWESAIAPFSILSSSIWLQMLLSSSGAIFQARNKSKLFFTVATGSAIIIVASIILGVILGGIVNVSISLAIGIGVNFLWSTSQLIKKCLDGSYFEYGRELISPLILGLIIFTALELIKYVKISNNFFDLVINIGVFVIIYVGYIFLSNEKSIIVSIYKR